MNFDVPGVSGSGELISVPALATPPGFGRVVALLDTDLPLGDSQQRLLLALRSAARTPAGELGPDASSAQLIASGVAEAFGESARSGVVLTQIEGRILVSPLRGGILYRYRNPTAEHVLGRVEVYDHVAVLGSEGEDGDLLILGTGGLARHISGFEVRRAMLAYDYADAMMWLLWLTKRRSEEGVGLVGLHPETLVPPGARRPVEIGRHFSPVALPRPLRAARSLLPRHLIAGATAAIAILILAATVLTGRLTVVRPLAAEGSSPATPRKAAATRVNPRDVRKPAPPTVASPQRVHPAPILIPTGLTSRQAELDELLSWHPVPGATGYLVHIGHRVVRSTSTSLRLHGTIRPKVTYHWSVRAIFPHGSGRSSATAQLQMTPAPAPTWHFHALRRPAESIALLVQNPGTATQQVTVSIRGPGESTHRVLSLPPGTTARLPLPLAPPANRSVPIDVVSTGPVLPMTVVARGKSTELQYGTPLTGGRSTH